MNANRKTIKGKKKTDYTNKVPKRGISQIHIARGASGLGCKNCIYANFCAAQPTLRAYVQGVYPKDDSELKNNENWRAI